MSEVLAATDVRARLFEALGPLVLGLMAQAADPDDVLGRVAFYVRPYPLPGEGPGARIFVVREVDEDRSDELTRGLVADMPNHAALERALEDVVAGVLAGLGGEAAEHAVAATQRHAAVLLVVARPGDGSVKLLIVPKRGRPLVLGALVDAPATVH